MNFSDLRQNMIERFSMYEVKEICFDLGIDFDSLPGSGKDAKVLELVDLCRRQGKIPDLVEMLSQLRPDIEWKEPISNPIKQALSRSSTQKVLIGLIFVIVTLFLILIIFEQIPNLISPPENGDDIVGPSTQVVSVIETPTRELNQENLPTQSPTVNINEDTDGDGLSNSFELEIGTDPNKKDTDRDGLEDGEEVYQYGTNPKKNDTDSDTLSDGDEILEHNTSPTNEDTDRDGKPDGIEVRNGSNPLGNDQLTPTINPETTSPTPTKGNSARAA